MDRDCTCLFKRDAGNYHYGAAPIWFSGAVFFKSRVSVAGNSSKAVFDVHFSDYRKGIVQKYGYHRIYKRESVRIQRTGRGIVYHR